MAPARTKAGKSRKKSAKKPPSSNTRSQASRRPGASPFTADQTNKILAAVVDHDPWNQPHGQKDKAWCAALEVLNNSGAFDKRLSLNTIRDKIRACVESHESLPERTQFTESDGAIYHSQIDLIRGRIGAAKARKADRQQTTNERFNCLEREGHVARHAALSTYTEAQAAEATIGGSSNEENPSPDQQSPCRESTNLPADSGRTSSSVASSIRSVLSALQHVNQVEGERFERLMAILVDEHCSIAKLAESTNALARAQAESNHLLRCMISHSGIAIPPFSPESSNTTPEPA